MTDVQILSAAIIAAGGTIGGALKWAVTRMTKAQDRATDALIANTASNATLVAKLETALNRIDKISDFVDETSGVHHTPPTPEPAKRRTATPAEGRSQFGGYYGPHRPKTEPGG